MNKSPKSVLAINPKDRLQVSMPGDLSNSTIFRCGYSDAASIYEHIYPELKDKIRNATLFNRRKAKLATEKDILLQGSGGYCGAPPKLTTNWFITEFKGTVVQINRESFTDGDAWRDLNDISTIPKNQYHLGFVADGCQSLRVYYMAQFFVLERRLWDFFLQEKNKRVSSKERFLIYTSSNCVDYREKAFDAIALANPTQTVEYLACSGKIKNKTNTKKNVEITKERRYNGNW